MAKGRRRKGGGKREEKEGRKTQKEEAVLAMRQAMAEFKEAAAGPIEGRGEELKVRKKGGRKGMWLSCP